MRWLPFMLLAQCTYLIVKPVPPPEPGKCPTEMDPRPRVDIVYNIRLSRRLVSLSSVIDLLDGRLQGSISARRALVAHTLVLPLVTEAEAQGPLYFDKCEQPAAANLMQVLEHYGEPLSSNNKDECELSPLAAAGKDFGTLVPTWPGALLMGAPPEQLQFFEKPPRVLMVVTIDPQAREHNYADCTFDNRQMGAFFGESSRWLSYGNNVPLPQVYFLNIGTSENGEGVAAFQQECLDLPDFPSASLDALAPSPKPMLTQFTQGLNDVTAGHATFLEMCEALSSQGTVRIDEFVRKAL